MLGRFMVTAKPCVFSATSRRIRFRSTRAIRCRMFQPPRSYAMQEQSLSTDQIRQRVQELGKWFHNLDLQGVQTAPDHFLGDYPTTKWQRFASAIPTDLRGKTVLDIGCNAGFYSIQMKQRGAERV